MTYQPVKAKSYDMEYFVFIKYERPLLIRGVCVIQPPVRRAVYSHLIRQQWVQGYDLAPAVTDYL